MELMNNEMTSILPENLRSSLLSIEELEAELGGVHQEGSGDEKCTGRV